MLDTAAGQNLRSSSRRTLRGEGPRVKLTKRVQSRPVRETHSPPGDLNARLRRAAKIAFTHFGED